MPLIKEVAAPSVLDGQKVKYRYDRVNVFTPPDCPVDFSKLDPGDRVTLAPEPTNPKDPRAVSVIHSVGKVGYLYRGRLQDMANDYIAVKRPVYAHIDSIDDDARKITLFLAFYGSTLFVSSQTYKLTGCSNKAAQEAIGCLIEDEYLPVSYDLDKDKYEVTDGGEVIGYLPKAANNLAETMDCYVDSIETDDNDKYVVYVRFEKPVTEKTSAPPPPPDPVPVSVPSPPPPKPAAAPKPEPVLDRAEKAPSSAPVSSFHQSNRPVSPDVQRTKDLFLVLYPGSKITLCQQLSGGGNYFSIHAVQDGKENRFIVQYDEQANAIDCYDIRMNPLSTTRTKTSKSKRRHPVLWFLFFTAVVLAVFYFLR